MKQGIASKWRLVYYGKSEGCCLQSSAYVPLRGLPLRVYLAALGTTLSSLRKSKFRCAPFSLPSFAASLHSAKCHLVPRCHCSLTLGWPWLFPFVPHSNSPRPAFATVRIYLTFVRQNPTSFLGRIGLAGARHNRPHSSARLRLRL